MFHLSGHLVKVDGEVLPNFFLPRQTIKVEAFIHMAKSIHRKQHKTHQKHQKNSCKPSVSDNFAVHLWNASVHCIIN